MLKEELQNLLSRYGTNIYKMKFFKEQYTDRIIEKTSFFDYEVKMRYRVMCILNDINKYPKCNCGAVIKKITTGHVFASYCSDSCFRKYRAKKTNIAIEKTRKTRNANRKENLINFNDSNYTIIEKNDLLKFLNIKLNKNLIFYIDDLIKYNNELKSLIYYTSSIPIIQKPTKISDFRFPFRIICFINDVNPICECGNLKTYYERKISKYCKKCQYKKISKNVSEAKLKYSYNDIVSISKQLGYEVLFNEFTSRGLHKFKHKACGKTFERKLQGVSTLKKYFDAPDYFCPYCSKKSGSKWEREVRNYLKEINIESVFNSRPLKDFKQPKCKGDFEIDILIKDFNLGIECDGIFCHTELNGNKNKEYHLEKTRRTEEQLNAQLLHIFDSEWILKKDIVKSIIASKLGIYKQRYYARKCKVKEIDAKTKNGFLDKNHLQGKDRSSVKLGLYHDNDLLAVMTFGKRQITGKKSFELIRFATKLNTQVVGGASKLFKYFLRNCWEGQEITTYADRRYSDGTFYEKLGFKLSHCSKPNYWYTQDYLHLEHRVKYQKHKLINILKEYDPELTEWENMQINGYDRIWDCGNYVFTYK